MSSVIIQKSINPKTKRNRYRAKYKCKKIDGTNFSSSTGWFESKLAAKEEAIKRIKNCEEGIAEEMIQNISIGKLLQEYEKICEDELKSVEYERVSTKDTLFRRIRSLRNNHLPDDVSKWSLKNLNNQLFTKWLYSIKNKKLKTATKKQYKSAILNFNNWLYFSGKHGSRELYLESKTTISEYKVYVENTQRQDRHTPSVEEITAVIRSFDLSSGNYETFYWYSLIYTLFWSGLRVEELIALEWKNVDFCKRKISIENAITERDTNEIIRKRKEKNYKLLKTAHSNRNLPMIKNYYCVLEAFKNATQLKYNLRDEEIGNRYIFPNLKKRKNSNDFISSKMIRYRLQKHCALAGVKYFDAQMCRHGLAKFLYSIGYLYEDACHYFGHKDSKMLKNVYAKLDKAEIEMKIEIDMLKHNLIKKDEMSKEASYENDKTTKYREKILNLHDKDDRVYERLLGQMKRKVIDGGKEFVVMRNEMSAYNKILENNKDVIDEFKKAKIRVILENDGEILNYEQSKKSGI